MDYDPYEGEITIRLATREERARGYWPALIRGGEQPRVPKYVVVALPGDTICSVFGLPQGGDTRSEAVFWAERFASKNGYRFIRPEGWSKTEGRLRS